MSSLHDQTIRNKKQRPGGGHAPKRWKPATIEGIVITTRVVNGKTVITSATVQVARSNIVG